MNEVKVKPWWTSKTLWAAVVTVLVTVYNAVADSQPGWPAIPEQIYALLGAVGLYGIRTASTTIGTPTTTAPMTPDNVIPAALTAPPVLAAPAWPDAAEPLEERL